MENSMQFYNDIESYNFTSIRFTVFIKKDKKKRERKKKDITN